MKKNTLWNLFSSVLPMLIGVISVPLLIKRMGIESFGVLSIIWTLIGYFSIFDFGIGRALTQQVSQLKSETDKLVPIIKTGMLFMLITGLIGGLILVLVIIFWGVSWLNVSQSINSKTISAFLIAAIGIPFTTITSGIKGILEGFEDFKNVAILKMILGLSNFLFPIIIVLYINNSLIYVVLSLVISRFFVMIIHFIPLMKHIYLKTILQSNFATKKETKSTLTFGAWMTLSNIVSPLMVNSDRFLISSVLGASAVAYYTVPFDIIIRLLVIPAALTTTLFPRFSALYRKNNDELYHLYRKSIFYIGILMSIISLGIMIFSYFGLSIWISKDFAEHSWKLTCILAIGLVFNSMSQVPYALIQARTDVKLTSLIHIVEFILYVPLLFLFIKNGGILGAAIVWSLRVILDFVLLTFFAKKKINLGYAT